jgi:beta-fructofuranosidase
VPSAIGGGHGKQESNPLAKGSDKMHWRPGADEYVGDMIPFFWQGEYHIFYLKRRGSNPYPWCHIKSRDLLHWETLPDVVHPGAPREADAAGCWTGSVVYHKGIFYCFYTGWNPEHEYPQTICLATSKDLEYWEKASDNPLLVPDERWYEALDWRDPYVFYNSEAQEWWMAICARERADLPGRRMEDVRRGCLALAVSKDLKSWEVHEPLWSGGVCWAPECPDVFRLGERWYIVYSHGITRYRFSESIFGPWLTGAPDSLDGHEVCAGKTLNDGRRQLLFGWIPTRECDQDGGGRQWGGHMAIPRVLVPQPNGTLLPHFPEEYETYGQEQSEWLPVAEMNSETLRGVWHVAEDTVCVDTVDGVALKRIEVPPNFMLAADIELHGLACEAGFLIRMSPEGDAGRKVAVEPSRGRVAVYCWNSWGDPKAEITRPVRPADSSPLSVRIVCHGSILEVFLGGQASIATRLYHPPEGWLGLWAANGSVKFGEIRLRSLPPLT